VLTDGKRPEGLEKGYYLEPTIITGLDREGGIHSFEFYSELSNVCIKL